MRRIHARIIAAAVLACSGAACGGAAHHAYDAHRASNAGGIRVLADGVPVEVRNDNDADMKVFVVVGGAWRFIGFVNHRSSASFDLGALELTGAPLRLLAMPVGRPGQVRSEPLSVLPGQTVTFTIEPDLTRSSATVR